MKYTKKKVSNVLILDIWLRNSPLDGLGILEQVKSVYQLLPVIMISGHGTTDNVVPYRWTLLRDFAAVASLGGASL